MAKVAQWILKQSMIILSWDAGKFAGTFSNWDCTSYLEASSIEVSRITFLENMISIEVLIRCHLRLIPRLANLQAAAGDLLELELLSRWW